MAPLPEGFKPAKRIENAATLRLTDAGIGFLESNVGTLANSLLGGGSQNGVLSFEIPPTNGSAGPIKYDVCKNGPQPNGNPPECVAEIDLGNAKLSLEPAAPHNLKVTGPLPLRLRKLPLKIEYLCVPGLGCVKSDIYVTLTGNDACSGDQTMSELDLDVDINISIDENQQHSRYGYSKVGVNVGVDKNQLQDSIRICGDFSAVLLNGLLSLAGDLLLEPLIDTIKDQVDQALCIQANPNISPACPSGTQDVGGICRYGTDDKAECASIALGTEGKLDVGALLGSISPGASGSFDFLLAAGGQGLRNDNSGHHWGDLNPVANGITLGMYGGTEPTAVSGCVPLIPSMLPTGIPVPDEVLGNSVGEWPTDGAPHFGLALSERFANYALHQVFNSGALCLGISADAIGTPVTSTILGLGLGAKSLTELGKQKQAASVAFLLRPQKPPTIAFGNGTDIEKDPLLDIQVPSMAIDFYVWSLDRFIRAMTVTTDLQVPANLSVTPEGLTPVIKAIKLSNTSVSNHEQLLRDDPAAIAEALEGLVGQLVGGALGGALSPIDLNGSLASLGLTLQIPESMNGKGSPGLRKLTKGTDDFLGIFAALGLATPPPMMKSSTKADVLGFEVDPAGLRLETWTPHNAPRARLRLGSSLDDGTRAIEWQHRVDNGPWRPFASERELDLRDPVLRNQGVHKIQVRSRVVGEPMTLDPEPALIELRVDAMPPEVRVVREANRHFRVEASDLVSGDEVEVRVRLGIGSDAESAEWGEWSAWQPVAELASIAYDQATLVEVEARDEGGNVGTVSQALIRGQASGAASGCQCAIEPGAQAPTNGLGLAASLLLAGAFLFRRGALTVRRASLRIATGLGLVIAVGSAPGCSCSAEETKTEPLTGCRARGDCEVVQPGLIGAYSSVAVAGDGSVWVAGYLEGNWDPDYGYSYGDLVVGRANDSAAVEWKVVDGTSPDEEVDPEVYDPQGFRGGKTDSGDDVGQWTSIALDATGAPGVAYYDATNRALKYAHATTDGWSVTTVQSGASGSDYGTYAKLAFLNGRPTIAYHFIEAGSGGAVSGVRLATGSDAAGGAWSFEDVVADKKTPCKPALCGAGQQCLVSGKCVAKKDGCDSCGAGAECVDNGMGGQSCEPVRGASDLVTYPNEVGLYVSMVVGNDGAPRVAYYDRTRGDVLLATKNGAAWTTLVVDGSDGTKDTGDKGIGLSLASDDKGDLHLTYVDGLSESLVHRKVQGGTTLSPVEVVDNGLGANDGHHLVGDDSNLFVTPGGELRVSYQDATTGTLVLATGTLSGDKYDWKTQVIQQEGFAGFFSKQFVSKGAYRIANWWRVGNPLPKGDVRFVAP
ncbi:MAG: hypothetical protein FJ095_01030 [Deltaproteobacteria bacterium]|nr:hypothetical protein [Deltaproteobacteria bacterium]